MALTVGTLTLNTTTNQQVCGTGSNLTTLSFPAPSGAVTLTYPNTTDTIVGRATTDTLTHKTLTAPVIATIVNTGTLTLPTSTDTLVARTTTDTLTNKTLTAPVIATIVNTGTLTLPTATDTLVARTTTDTLTNKTLTSANVTSIATFSAIPAAPASGALIFSNAYTNNPLLSQIGPTNAAYMFQPHLSCNNYAVWKTSGGTTATLMGFGNTVTGTATARAPTSTNLFTSTRRMGFVTSSLAGSGAGTLHGTQCLWMGNAAGLGGFLYIARAGVSSAATVANQRVFVGLVGQTTAITATSGTLLSATVNMLGFGYEGVSGDTSWFFYHNAGSGTATKTALTGTFPVNTLSVDMYEFRIFCAPNTTTIYFSIQNLRSNAFFASSVTSNIPANTTFLCPQIWTGNNSTALAAGIDVISQYMETDF
jgi:hypothetical protein